MSFHQLIQYKTLNRMYAANNDGLLEMSLRDPQNEEFIKKQMKNVCALISVKLFDQLDGVCDVLEISKRQFIEYAIIEALAKAENIMEETGFYDKFAVPETPVANVIEDAA